MGAAAAARGAEYLGIADHSASARYAHGLSEQRLGRPALDPLELGPPPQRTETPLV